MMEGKQELQASIDSDLLSEHQHLRFSLRLARHTHVHGSDFDEACKNGKCPITENRSHNNCSNDNLKKHKTLYQFALP